MYLAGFPNRIVNRSNDTSTATGIYTSVKDDKPVGPGCVFCNMPHKAQDCIKAQSIPLSGRKTIVNNKKPCFFA